MSLVIYRQPLADPGEITAVGRYHGVTLYTGNCFIELIAKGEADRRGDCTHISVRETKPDLDGIVRHIVTLMGHNNVSLAEYYGEWQ